MTYSIIDGDYEIVFRKIYNHDKCLVMFFPSIFHAEDILQSGSFINYNHFICHSIPLGVDDLHQLIKWGFENPHISVDHISQYCRSCAVVTRDLPLSGWIDPEGKISYFDHSTIVPRNQFYFDNSDFLYDRHTMYHGNPLRKHCIKPNTFWISSQNNLDDLSPANHEIWFEENIVSYYDPGNNVCDALRQITLNYAKYLQSFNIQATPYQLVSNKKIAYSIEITPEQMSEFELLCRLAN